MIEKHKKEDVVLQMVVLVIGLIIGFAAGLLVNGVYHSERVIERPDYSNAMTGDCPLSGGMSRCYLIPIR